MWGEVPLPEDLEANKDVQASQSFLDDDEDFAADEASGGGLDRGWIPAVLHSQDMFFIMHSLHC